MKNLFGKTVMGLAVAASLSFASSGAMAFPTFTVNENFLGGTTGLNTADKITGNYFEVITVKNGQFDASLLFQAGQLVDTNSTSLPSSSIGSGTGHYELYALYQAKGTTSGSGADTTFNVTPNTGSFTLFADPNSDTKFKAPATGSTPYTILDPAKATDDFALATGVPTFGLGKPYPNNGCSSTGGQGINCGSFGNTVSVNLTESGSKYFVAPAPFYNLSFQSGQFNSINVDGTTTTNGSLDLVFDRKAVPEPGSIALFGLGLAGLMMGRRRSKKQA